MLAALNIADECFHALDRNRDGRDVVVERVARIERLLDEALASAPPNPHE